MKNLILFSIFLCVGAQISLAQPGSLNTAFGSDGVVKTDLGKSFYPVGLYETQVILGPSGTIYFISGAAGATFITKRHSDGRLDSSYGKNGFSAIVPMDLTDGLPQTDGKILIVGVVSHYYENYIAIARLNTNGNLDSSFGENGMRTYVTENNAAKAAVLQANGKIVVATNYGLTRFNGDGSNDNSFSGDGKTPFNGVDEANSLNIQNDGKIVVTGTNFSTNTLEMCRYNANGSPDSTFGVAGNMITSFDGSVYYFSSVIQNDGKIVVAGIITSNPYPYPSNLLVIRYNQQGIVDNTFGTNGKFLFGAGTNLRLALTEIALQKDKKIVLALNNQVLRINENGRIDSTFSKDGKQASTYTIYSGKAIAIEKNGKVLLTGIAHIQGQSIETTVPGLSRFNTDGSVDSTFGTNGTIHANLRQGNTVYKSTAVQKDGKVVAAGYTWSGNKFVFAVSRFKSNGSLDSSFSGDGTKTTSFGNGDDFGNSVAIQADGKIVVVGSCTTGTKHKFAFARYNTNGDADNTFSGDGRQEISFGIAGKDYANAVAIQADGKIVAGGANINTAGLVRLNPNGEPDITFGGGDGKQTFGNVYPISVVKAITIQQDGRIVVAGFFGFGYVLARFTSNGYLDKTFGDSGLAKTNFQYVQDGYNYYSGTCVAVQSDGKIIVGSNVNYFEDENAFVINRYTKTGRRDSTFGQNGRVQTTIAERDYVNALAIESDGKILAAGIRENHSSITRITLKGALDSTFGVNGIQTTLIGGYIDEIDGIAIDSNNLYAVGTGLFPGMLGTVIKYQLNTSAITPLVKGVAADSYTNLSMVPGLNADISRRISLRLSPNPAQSILTINTTGLSADKAIVISVITSSGVVIKTLRVSRFQNISLDVSTLKSGLYIIKMISGDQVMYNQFIKNVTIKSCYFSKLNPPQSKLNLPQNKNYHER